MEAERHLIAIAAATVEREAHFKDCPSVRQTLCTAASSQTYAGTDEAHGGYRQSFEPLQIGEEMVDRVRGLKHPGAPGG